MVVHDTSHKPFPPPLSAAARGPLATALQHDVQQYCFCGLMHLSVPSPSFSAWELSVTENPCQSVLCVGRCFLSVVGVANVCVCVLYVSFLLACCSVACAYIRCCHCALSVSRFVVCCCVCQTALGDALQPHHGGVVYLKLN